MNKTDLQGIYLGKPSKKLGIQGKPIPSGSPSLLLDFLLVEN